MPKKTPNHKQSLKIPKLILLFSKIFASISPKLSVLFSAKLFTTPIKHRTPKREMEMEKKSIQKLIKIPVINKKVMTYEYGKSDKKILLSHGWSGRGTHLFKIADELVKSGYSIVSFDAPAHGKSPGKTTIMSEFIETILEVEKQFGPFEGAVGHSLGGMSLLNATKKGLAIKTETANKYYDWFKHSWYIKVKENDEIEVEFEVKDEAGQKDEDKFYKYSINKKLTFYYSIYRIVKKGRHELTISEILNLMKHYISDVPTLHGETQTNSICIVY